MCNTRDFVLNIWGDNDLKLLRFWSLALLTDNIVDPSLAYSSQNKWLDNVIFSIFLTAYVECNEKHYVQRSSARENIN